MQSGSAPSARPRRAILAIALAAAALLFVAAYANSWRNSFHFDDTHVIETNPAIGSLAHSGRFFTDARTFSSLPANQTYRPLETLTLAVDHAVALAFAGDGLDPRAYHLTQLLLLALTATLAGLVARRVFAGGARGDAALDGWVPGAAVAVGALFALHVGNTQVGNYISARSESLSAIGLLAGLLLFMRGGAWRRWHVYLLPMALGALAKSPAVLLAPLLLIWRALDEEDVAPSRLRSDEGRAALRRAVVGALPAFAVGALLFVFVEGMNPPAQTYGGGARFPYMWTQLWVTVRYVGMFVVPTGLSADSDWTLLASPFDLRVAVGLALLAASAWGAWRAAEARRTRPIAFGIVWFWIGIMPTAVVPLAEVTNDHRPFLGFIGLTMAAVWGAVLVIRRVASAQRAPRVATAAAVAAVALHAAGTHARNRAWATEASLWADVVRTSPGNARGLMNFGLTAMRAGRYGAARSLFDSAAALAPGYALIYVNRAIATDAQGDSAAAEADFRRALALAPDDADCHRYYGRWLAAHGRGPEALEQYARAVTERPEDVDARRERLLLLAAGGAPAVARAAASGILALAPNDSVAIALAAGRPAVAPAAVAGDSTSPASRWYLAGWALTRAGRHAEAIEAYRAAVAADPTLATAWNNLGWSLGALGFFDAAQPALERAVALAPTYALARNNLAWVAAERRRQASALTASR